MKVVVTGMDLFHPGLNETKDGSLQVHLEFWVQRSSAHSRIQGLTPLGSPIHESVTVCKNWISEMGKKSTLSSTKSSLTVTNYVFDGTSPPYTPSSSTNPLQLYGRSKRDGEVAVLGVDGAKVIVLRVPVLYGPAPQNSDSAINILLDVVQDQSGKTYKMDHYATRYPTNVLDIADFLVRLTGLKKPIPPILHYSSDEPFTKYEICLTFAKILGLPHKHIIPDAEPPSGEGATTRPRDCHLYTKETEDLAVDGGLGLSLFEEWWTSYLKK
ncbi:Methionine adenosyltransferase 2 subunit beta [Psilocybe cubensis]|uniref:Methionine adenosyltransferase 2 subunit beta n=1 Tax=Psilocybe cubensis TaxID=181762 RepID=A0ACB8GS32_PSICU|nr:Methionine adenosyltransferase 2 subunit beta [Psilocybe cubensis]KAH9478448.1 Methionine adenosyltransferase 2 subunit beta [Psilocybe cubensis]